MIEVSYYCLIISSYIIYISSPLKLMFNFYVTNMTTRESNLTRVNTVGADTSTRLGVVARADVGAAQGLAVLVERVVTTTFASVLSFFYNLIFYNN